MEKDFQRGMAAGAKPFEEKFEQLNSSTRKVGEKVNKKLDEFGNIMDAIIDDMSDMQKKELYDLNTPYDLKDDLDEDEKEVLAALLIKLSERAENNQYQQKFIRSVNAYIGMTTPQQGFDIACIENIESIKVQKVIMQALMEYLYLEYEDFSFMEGSYEEIFAYFSINKKGIEEIEGYILTVARAVGKDGIAEKYGFVPEEEEADEKEVIQEEVYDFYDGSDISEACADTVNVHDYLVLQDYLVYAEDPWSNEIILHCIEKQTGKDIKKEPKLGNVIRMQKDICDYGNSVYLFVGFVNEDQSGIYKFNIENNEISQIASLFSMGMLNAFNSPQCNSDYLVFDDYFNEGQLQYINLETKERNLIPVPDISVFGGFRGVVLKDHNVFYNYGSLHSQDHYDRGVLCRYDLKSKELNILCELADENMYIFRGVINYSYRQFLFSVGGSRIDLIDLKNPAIIRQVIVPSVYGRAVFAEYEYVYYFEPSASCIHKYNILTGQVEKIEISDYVEYVTTGTFRKKTTMRYSDMQKIGKWLYYRGAEHGSIRKIYKVDLETDEKKILSIGECPA